MIQVQQRVLPETEANDISEWLRDPRAKRYITYLEHRAAERTAHAGNLLLEGTETAKVDAKTAAEEARQLHAVINLLREHSAFEYKFRVIELKPQPHIQT